MGFIVGFLTGIIAGAAGAVFYSIQTGRDLQSEFRQLRSEVEARDVDALGKHLEERFREIQASVERMRSDVEERSKAAADDMTETLETAAEEAGPAADDASRT